VVEIFPDVTCLALATRKAGPEKFRLLYFHDPDMNLQTQALMNYFHMRFFILQNMAD
jgi:hypothetical protein